MGGRGGEEGSKGSADDSRRGVVRRMLEGNDVVARGQNSSARGVEQPVAAHIMDAVRVGRSVRRDCTYLYGTLDGPKRGGRNFGAVPCGVVPATSQCDAPSQKREARPRGLVGKGSWVGWKWGGEGRSAAGHLARNFGRWTAWLPMDPRPQGRGQTAGGTREIESEGRAAAPTFVVACFLLHRGVDKEGVQRIPVPVQLKGGVPFVGWYQTHSRAVGAKGDGRLTTSRPVPRGRRLSGRGRYGRTPPPGCRHRLSEGWGWRWRSAGWRRPNSRPRTGGGPAGGCR